MHHILITFAWCWFCLGIASGALLGLGFHKPGFMGGYGSWRRRLTRLGHIAFFGTGFLALAMGLTTQGLSPSGFAGHTAVGVLTLSGGVTMPTVCFLSAWRKGWRHLFVVPVATLGIGVVWFTVELVLFTTKDGWPL